MYEKVVSLCRQKGIPVCALEKTLGFSNGAIGKWRQSMPKSDSLHKVAQFFNVRMDWFFET